MDEIKPQKTKVTLGLIVRWALGILFLISGLGTLFSGSILSGLFFFIISFVLMPPTADFIENKMNITMSWSVRAIVVIVLLCVAGFAAPHNTSTPVNSNVASGDIANANTADAIAVKADSANANSVNDNKPEATPTPTIYKAGDRVVVGGRAYTVNSVRTTSSVGDQYFNAKATGIFVIVDMTIETLEKETTQMMNTDVKVVDSQGRTFQESTDGSIHIKDNLFLKQLQPGLPAHGEAIFDVPKGITANLQVCEGGFGSKTELISLGTLQ